MITDVLTVIFAIVSALLVGFAARRILDAPVGWPRSLIVGFAVFALGLPSVRWILDQSGLIVPGRTPDTETALVALAVIALSAAWSFALGLAVLVAIEAVFPTRPLPNPIDVIRAAIMRRKRTRRYLEIVAIASRHGAGWVVHGPSKAQRELTTGEQRANALVGTINDSGVTFVKLGQVLSTRRDLIPEPYISALASLQSGATTLSWETIRPVIETELGRPIDEVFASIDTAPLAAASVAQVHTAVLTDGTPVVVKVQRPAARAQVEADVDIIQRLARRVEQRTKAGRDLRLESVARGFTSTLVDELDYRIEARNMEMIRHALTLMAQDGGDATTVLSIPAVYPDASSNRLLTMDLVDGQPLSRAGAQLATMTPEQRDALALGLMTSVIEQILIYGVFHADLHPGNVILRTNGTLGLIDFGAIGIIERSQREHLTAMLLGALTEDDVTATDALLLIVDVPDDVDVDAFRHDIGIVLTSERFHAGGGSIFSRMVDVIREHHIALPGDLASAFRSFATLEGCLRVLVPDFDMVGRALPVVPQLVKHMLSPRRALLDAEGRAIIANARLRALPLRVDALMSALQNGTGAGALHGEVQQGFVRSITSQIVGALVSIAAVALAVVFLVTNAGPQYTAGLGLFDLIGAAVGLFGFLGLMRVVRQLFAAGQGLPRERRR
ncbi:ABC1 kinase family protein [Microbacterium sp. P04]|uniref:ABC1 kinase family protein n=1 Tax=Microbacterium sp. P04 TaxID=3366947 RepID=UPI0037461931